MVAVEINIAVANGIPRFLSGESIIEDSHHQPSLVAVRRTTFVATGTPGFLTRGFIEVFYHQAALWWQWEGLQLWLWRDGLLEAVNNGIYTADCPNNAPLGLAVTSSISGLR